MPLDTLPGKLVVSSRGQLREKFLLWTRVRNPATDSRPGTAVYLDACVYADAATLILAQAVTVSNGITRATSTGAALDAKAAELGTSRQPPVGATGAVSAVIGAAGATIFAGDLLTHIPTGLRFQVTVAGSYPNGYPIPISGVDVGPSTNLAAGTVLTWASPRPGVTDSAATVMTQADGSGLSDGANAESDDALRARLDYLAANPPASGNAAEYIDATFDTAGLAIQQAFAYDAVPSPGAISVAFTLTPAQPGANRIPNSTQMALVATNLGGQMPGSDSIFLIQLIADPVTLVYRTLWAPQAAGWADATTFPQYHATPNLVSAAPDLSGNLTPTQFKLQSSAMTEVPQVGQSIAFFDLPNLTFRRKKILAVIVRGPSYDITVDTTNGISDVGYTPTNGQPCCPWSDSLDSLVPALTAYFDTIGPGEMFASFFDPGLRQRRTPLSPQFWPSAITNRMLGGASTPVAPAGPQQNQPAIPTLLNTSTLQDVVLVEPTVPFAPPIGTPGVSAYLFTMSNAICAFPE